MAKEIDKIIQSKTAPKSNNVLWDDGENLKINRNGKWENTGAPMINITYANLVELRNNNKLIAGMQYRITDYVTTTAQENTRSAGHQFDIIVTADNENTLNEVARACRSEFNIEKYKDAFCGGWGEKMLYVGTQEYEGKEYHLYESESQDLQMLVDFNQIKAYRYQQSDPYPCYCYPSFARGYDGSIWEDWQLGLDYGETIQFKYDTPDYFATSKLEAWQIWYSLDNDTERFAWAMMPPLYSPRTKSKMIMVKDADNETYIYIRSTDYDENGKCGWLYTVEGDSSSFLEFVENGKESVDIEDRIYTDSEVLTIGDILDTDFGNVTLVGISYIEGKGVIYRMIDEWNNDLPYDFKNIQFKRGMYDGGEIAPDGDEDVRYYLFTFSFKTEDNEIIDTSIFGNNGRLPNNEGQITGVYGNIIGQYMTYDSSIENPTKTSQRLNDIVFYSHYDYDESLHYSCNSNRFGTNCYSNSFGTDCNSNSFDNNCSNNSFGDHCNLNSFGNNCSFNSFSNNCNSNSFGNDFYGNSFNDVCYSNSFSNGCNNIKLSESTLYQTVSVNSNGEVKMFNLADLVDLLNS